MTWLDWPGLVHWLFQLPVYWNPRVNSLWSWWKNHHHHRHHLTRRTCPGQTRWCRRTCRSCWASSRPSWRWTWTPASQNQSQSWSCSWYWAIRPPGSSPGGTWAGTRRRSSWGTWWWWVSGGTLVTQYWYWSCQCVTLPAPVSLCHYCYGEIKSLTSLIIIQFKYLLSCSSSRVTGRSGHHGCGPPHSARPWAITIINLILVKFLSTIYHGPMEDSVTKQTDAVYSPPLCWCLYFWDRYCLCCRICGRWDDAAPAPTQTICQWEDVGWLGVNLVLRRGGGHGESVVAAAGIIGPLRRLRHYDAGIRLARSCVGTKFHVEMLYVGGVGYLDHIAVYFTGIVGS